MKSIDFYYSIGSRYSYLAHSQVAALERDYGVAVRWQPLNSAALMSAAGRTPFAGPPPSTQYDPGYRSIDAERWARFYGIPYREPDWTRIDFARVNMAVVASADQADPQAYSRALFALAFETGARTIDDTALKAAADSTGLDGARLVRDIDAEKTAARHHTTIEAALAAGVFGVPSFVIGTQMYWGNDRLALLRHHLAETL